MYEHESHLEDMIPHEMIAVRAHQLWVLRGCPIGQPDQDWFAARRELERELTVSEVLATARKHAA